MRGFWLALPLMVVACNGDGDDDGQPGGEDGLCDPLDPSVCALPFPSQHFLKADDATATGYRVNFQDGSLPENYDGVQMRGTYFNEHDGFSINSPAIFFFEGLSLEGTIPQTDIGKYTAEDVKTVIIDTTTGERIPHWVELDGTAPNDVVRVTLLRPAVPLDWNHHYVVGLRGLVTGDGAPVSVSPAFRAMRDGEASDDFSEERRAHFDEVVFPALEAEGFARSELQLAWDFHTVSRDSMLGRMDFLVEDGLAWAGSEGWTVTFTKVEDRDCTVEGEHIARQVEGHFTAPLYTLADSPEDPFNGDDVKEALLTRDEEGMPFRNGTTEVEFLARVPCSVAFGPDGEGPVKAPVVQYGHGLLGSKGEANTGYLAEMADRYGFIIFAQDWTGFMEDDVNGITFMIVDDATYFSIIPERSMQGMMEKVLGLRMVAEKFISEDAFTFGDDDVNVVDPDQRYYYGNSQGAIMGSALLAMSPDLERGVLGVGGGPYSLLLPRSRDFDPFFLLFKQRFADHREIMLIVAGLTQQLWDPVEPGGWMWDMTRDADVPKQVLSQVGIYDNQVTTLGAQIQARAYGQILPQDANRVPWGLTEQDVGDGYEGGALVEWLYTDLPDEPTTVTPPGLDVPPPFDDGRGLDPHECPRREPEAQEQLWTFLSTGKVQQFCDGPCVGTVAERCP